LRLQTLVGSEYETPATGLAASLSAIYSTTQFIDETEYKVQRDPDRSERSDIRETAAIPGGQKPAAQADY